MVPEIFDFPVDFAWALQQCSANVLPVIQDDRCPPSWICYWTSWTAHEGLFAVCTPCEHFVIIDLVVFKLNGFEFFGRLCLKVPFRLPEIRFWGNLGDLNMICHQQYLQKAYLGVKPRVLSHKCFRSFHICDL